MYESLGQQLTNAPDELKAEMKRLYMYVTDASRTASMIKYMEALEATDPTSAFFLDQEKLQPLSTLGSLILVGFDLLPSVSAPGRAAS